MFRLVLACVLFLGCEGRSLLATGEPMPANLPALTTVSVANKTLADATVFAAFGADSKLQASAWAAFCPAAAPLNCSFLEDLIEKLRAKGLEVLVNIPEAIVAR